MRIEIELDEVEILAFEKLLFKLVHGAANQPFTAEELELMARMRENREAILAHFAATAAEFKAANHRGAEKIEKLTHMIEKICQA